ncbi:MAG: chlorophyll synthesis pathway protein BchC [Hydrogenophaga sp.]|nr:chlorophyll synthesis pathway protein BchC [Hydrogenophaga sp.]
MNSPFHTQAVVFESPQQLALNNLALNTPADADVVVEIDWSGISTGTEKLLWNGQMPSFPGMGYPLVPGYESVGQVVHAGAASGRRVGDAVFVPGSNGFVDARGLFGGAAKRVVLPGARTLSIDAQLGERGVLLALAATAQHALAMAQQTPQLIVGHGVLGRMVARLAVIAGGAPVVWDTNPQRRQGGQGYEVLDPAADPRRDYRSICDVSGDSGLLDTLIARLAPGGEVVLAGFYDQPLSFAFAPAFMREARLQIAAQWQAADLLAVRGFIDTGRLSLDGLITHRSEALDADAAYRTAFGDPACLKMVLNWSACA